MTILTLQTRGSQTGMHAPPSDICLSEEVHLRLAIEEKQVVTLCLFRNIHTYIKIIRLRLNISMNNHDEIFSHARF